MRTLILLAASTIAFAGAAFAHPATEQFIPIGQSPGGGTIQGTAEVSASPASGPDAPITIDRANGPDATFVLGPHTRIYIDRSAQNLPSLIGAPADVQPGRIIEVRLADQTTRVAEWVKVRP